MKRRKELYEYLHPETKKGTAGAAVSNKTRHGHNATSDKMSFAADTAAKTGKSRRTVERDIALAETIRHDFSSEFSILPATWEPSGGRTRKRGILVRLAGFHPTGWIFGG